MENCIYEHIKDTFYYGLFGDFRLVIDKSTGFFNATKLCDQGGKNYRNWSRLEKSKKMVEYYQKNCPDSFYEVHGDNENARRTDSQGMYEVKLQNNDKINKQITGTYVPFQFFEEIKSWIKFKKSDKRGVVYVVTNANLEQQLIHKIGYTQNLHDRLETFNKYRKFDPCFYPKLVYQSENAKSLEGKVHLALKHYSLGNEFFKVALDQIETIFTDLGYVPVEKHEPSKTTTTLNDVCYAHIKNTFYHGLKMNTREVEEKVAEIEAKMSEMSIEHEEAIRQKDDKINELITITKEMRDQNTRQEKMLRSLGITLNEVNDKNDALLDETKHLKQQTTSIQHKLDIAVKDRVPLPENAAKQERFVLLKRNDPDYYSFYTIRAQNDYTRRKLKTERLHFPSLEVLLDFRCSPNSKTLYVRIKESLKARGVEFRGNNIDLDGSEIGEAELVDEMRMINEARKEV